jgi:glucose/galactose transporter
MTQSNTKQGFGIALFLIGCLFFIFGFITWSNSQLIPYLKIACELSQSASYLVATAFFAAYFIMSLPASAILERIGYRKGMSLGLVVMAVGAILFIPAANARSYPLFLTGLFVIGTGLALLQTASNPYVTVLGPHEYAAQRMSIMGICNKLAGIIAVVVLGKITLSNADELIARLKTLDPVAKAAELDALAQRVVVPYGIIAGVLVALAVALLFVPLPEVAPGLPEPTGDEPEPVIAKPSTEPAALPDRGSAWAYPHMILGALAIFFYVGAEVISYDTFAGFGQQLGYSLDTAKNFATYTGYALLAGYVVGIVAIPKYISQQKALIAFTWLSLALCIVAMFSSGAVAIGAFAALGFSNSVMWPAIFPLALRGLGKYTKTGGALLVMGIAGGAVLPPLYGKLGEGLGNLQLAYLILIPCYFYILYYALKGRNAGIPAAQR